MDSEAHGGCAVVIIGNLGTHGLKHFNRVVQHVQAHVDFVLLELGVRNHKGKTPFVLLVRVKIDAVFMIGQALAEAAHID